MGALLIFIIIAALLIYTNQTQTSTETVEAFTLETSSFYADLNVMRIYTTDYVVQGNENRRLAEALSYGCLPGGAGGSEFSHTISVNEKIFYFPEEFLEDHLNSTLSSYRLEMDCDPTNESSKVVIAGEELPEDRDLTVREVPVPLPVENLTKARLYRWY